MARGGEAGEGRVSAPGLRRAAYAVMLAFCHTAGANPTGPGVAAGAAQFQSAGSTLTVTNAHGSIINWQRFSIGAGEHTRFEQPSAASSVLNRVVGGDPSGILGTLSSNGRVFLVNPSGIVFGPGATIDTAGFVASTLNIADRDFLEGRLRFEGGGAGALRNEGTIRAGGDIFLVGPQVENAGLVRSEAGSVVLAAGKSVTITGPDAQGVQFALQAPEDRVLNLGAIEAQNAAGLFAGTLRHSGDIRVAAGVDGAGKVVLAAQGDAILDGNATVSADSGTGRGGSVQILGERVGLLDTATVSASGATGGGEVLVGGDYQGRNPAVRNALATYVGPDATLRADATQMGDGGRVIVWSDEATRAYGAISARGGALGGDGGFVETSGAYLDVTRTPDVTAARGRGGQWLLDPNNINITNLAPHPGGTNVAGNPDFTTTNDGAEINQFTIQQALDAGTSVTITTGTAGANSEAGNINVSNGIAKTAGGDATLTLTAHNNINVNNSITSTSGKLNMVFNADSDSSGSGAVNITNNNPTLDANGGTIAINGNYFSVSGNLLGVLINNSTVTVARDFYIGGGATLDVQNGATLGVGGNFYFSDGTLRTTNGTGSTTVTGGVYVSGNGTKTLGGTHVLTNNGTGEWSGTGGFELSATFNNAGTLKILRDGQLFNQGGTFNNSGTLWKTTDTVGTTTIDDATFSNTGTVRVDSGTLNFAASTTFSTTGTLNVAAGAQLTSGNTITLAGGTLLGAGTVNANVNNTGGTVAPGSTVGTLTINGNYTQGAGGSLAIELGGTGAGQSDKLAVTGDATMGGTLTASTTGGYSPANGDAIAFLTMTGAAAGTFATVNAPANFNVGYTLFAGEAARLQYVAAAEEPSGPVARYFDNGAGSFDWGDPVNWAGDSLPGASEEAFIDAGYAVTHASGNDTVGALSIRSGNSLDVSGGSLTVSGATSLGGTLAVSGSGSARLGAWSGAGTANLGGGTLTLGSGGSGFSGAFNWSGGTLAGSGSLGSSIAFDLAGSGTRVLDGPTLGLSNLNLAGGSLDVQSGTLNLSGTTTVASGAQLSKSSGTLTVSGTLNNAGTVAVNAGTLTLGNGGTHTGTFSAASGATLAFSGGTHNLGDGAQLSGAGSIQFTGGTLNATGTGAGATLASGATFSLSGQTLGGTGKLTNLGTFNFDDSRFGGTLINRGTLNVNSGTSTLSGSSFDLDAGTLTIASGASLTKSGGAFNWSGGSIGGAGTLGTGSGATFNLTGSGTRELDGLTLNLASLDLAGGSLSLKSGELNLSGSSEVASGAALYLNGGTLKVGGTLDNAGTVAVNTGTLSLRGEGTHTGTFSAASGATLSFAGGTHNLADGAQLSGAGSIEFTGGTLNVTGTVAGATVAEGATFSLSSRSLGGTGKLTNLGTFNFDGGSFGGTLVNQGALNVNSGASTLGGSRFDLDDGTLTIAWGASLTKSGGAFNWGGGEIGGSGTLSTGSGATFNLVGRGTRVLDGPTFNLASLSVPEGFLRLESGALNLSGPATVASGAAFDLQGGILRVDGALTIDGQLDWTWGTLTGRGSTTVTEAGAFHTWGEAFKLLDGHTLTNNSAHAGLGGTGELWLRNGAVLNNTGTLTYYGYGDLSGQGTVNNSGVFRVSDTYFEIRGVANNLTFNNQAGGTFVVEEGAGVGVWSSVTFRNAGTIDLGGGARLRALTESSAGGPGTFDLTGGVLTGTGTIYGHVDNSGGTVVPGASVGTLVINGDYIQGVGGTLRVELAGTQPGSGHDLLQVSGRVSLDGSLEVGLPGGFRPAAGDAFDFLTYSGRAGDFARFDYSAGSAFLATPDTAFYRIGIPSPVAVTAATPSAAQPASLMLAMADKAPSISRAETPAAPAEDEKERAPSECRP